MKQYSVYILAFLFLSTSIYAQQDSLWHLNSSTDEEAGIDYDKALDFVSEKEAQPIIVAVIDDGVNVEHPDLVNMLWMNPKEIAGNGLDDDENGYVDDLYGWNFIGKTKEDNLEKARYVKIMESRYADRSKEEKAADPEYDKYLAVASGFQKEVETMENQAERVHKMTKYLNKVKRKHGETPSVKNIKRTFAWGGSQRLIKSKLKSGMNRNSEAFSIIYGNLDGAKKVIAERLSYHYNMDLDERAENVGDNYADVTEQYYGDNKVNYWSSGHGTHVAGIIAADASNDFGAVGICQSCKIMSVRTVPNGDERDKDVANSIIYAVDNGAKVINMSFGKSMSPNKDRVAQAIKYAEDNDVLLVHAAGNNASNNDEVGNFPNDAGATGKNWLEVGASSFKSSPSRLATFSNYGKSQVDLFAPGHMIYATYTDNGYKAISGTSMASPVVAGVAAFVWSYYPELTAAQLKQVLMNSTTPIEDAQHIPGAKDLNDVSELSVTGGIVNLYNALQEAERILGM